ncbi:MAG: peptidylprolyl isomerase [Mailhella sp.]|nr:peptidylprolyl isomerase [Mailhella sp.]
MKSDFTISFHHSNGNMHVGIIGIFSERCAESLRSLLDREYPGSGRIFVDTRSLTGIRAEGAELFRKELRQSAMPLSDLYFKGERGFEIAPDGSRVLIFNKADGSALSRGPLQNVPQKKHACCGKCAHCTCGGHSHGCGSGHERP